MQFCCIVKPPHYHLRYQILAACSEAGLLILESHTIVFTPELIATLYDHMSREAQTHIMNKYCGLAGHALRVSAPSIDALLDILGKESNPGTCATHSLRYRFGTHAPALQFGSWDWWENAIHRPVDERERLRDLALFT